MITVRNEVGRLVEVVVATPVVADDILNMGRDILGIIVRKKLIVGVTDLRPAMVFPGDLAEQITSFLKRDNPHIERSGFLINDSAVFGLQLERILREANNPSRKAFRTLKPLLDWVESALTPPELARVSKFLG